MRTSEIFKGDEIPISPSGWLWFCRTYRDEIEVAMKAIAEDDAAGRDYSAHLLPKDKAEAEKLRNGPWRWMTPEEMAAGKK